jgi:formate hydrogenlyase subunit 3/multisubunit Na+/H+ antiporter MnhD subunit
MLNLPLISLSLLLFSGILILLKNSDISRRIYAFLNISAGLLLIYESIQILISGRNAEFFIILNKPIEAVNLIIDPLSAFFMFLTAIMLILVTLYTLSYMRAYLTTDKSVKAHLCFLNIFMISIILVVMAQNALFFLIVWEVMSLSSFLLLSFENEKKEVQKASLSYFIWMHIGVILLIFAFISSSLLSKHSLDFEVFRQTLPGADNLNLIFILFFLGFGIKAGFVPFHSWLVKAHPAAPANISAVMSALMLKVGIYGILRMMEITQINSFSVSVFVLVIAIVSALWGIIYAVMQKDIKKILAYSSVENVGIICLGLALAMLGRYYGKPAVVMLGIGGSLFHILNHAVYKSSLFFTAGNVYSKLHEKDIDKLGGLSKFMPYTSMFALISCLSICALPPFNGFISEFLIFLSMFNGIDGKSPEYSLVFIIALISLACVGVVALIAFSRFYAFTFLGNPRKEGMQNLESSKDNSIIPLFLQAALIVLILVLAGPISTITFKIGGQIFNIPYLETALEYSPLIQHLSFYSLIFIGFAILMLGLKYYLNRRFKKPGFKTWDCGFQAGTSKMQYTGSSYSVDFYNLISIFFRKKTLNDDLKAIFPKNHSSNSVYIDLFETIIRPKYKNYFNYLVDKFSRIQSGNTQSYLMYGVIFLLILIIYVTFAG